MPIRPVSFLAQAAAQRQQTRENDANRQFQKEQAMRDFGMNIGQSIIASLGNFGAQAGADAIRFSREEPYKMLESGVNPTPEVSVAKPVGTGAADTLTRAVMARTLQPPADPAPPAPDVAPKAPPTPVRQPAPVSKPVQPAGPPQEQAPAFDPYKAMRDPSSVLPRQAAPAPSAPTAVSAPAPSGVMAGLKQAGAAGLRGPSAPPPAREEVVSQSTSQRGDAPEAQAVKLRALQEMEKITQRWLSGEPMRFVKQDGTPAEPREAAFAEAYQMKQDLNRLDMLSKAGLIEAQEAKAVAYRIKAQAEADAATTKAGAYEREKASTAWKNTGAAAKSVTQNYAKGGQLLSGAPREFVVTNDPNAPMWPSVESVPDPERPQYGGKGGGAPRTSAMFPDAEEVFALGYSETARDDRGRPLVGEKVLPEQYLAPVPGKEGLFRYVKRKDAPAIKAALDAGDLPTATSLFQKATAEHASQWDAARETATSPADKAKADEAAEKAKRAEQATAAAAELTAKINARKARDAAMADADQARAMARVAPKPEALFPGLDAEDAAEAAAALANGTRKPAAIKGPEWASAQKRLDEYKTARAAYVNRIAKARKDFIANGGTEAEWDELNPPPGPSEQSPGQFPPPGEDSPGDESKVDDLFQKIEAQPWSAERKRRVFLARAKEVGLV